MTQKELTTSWLWKAGEGVNGLKVDADTQRLDWFDSLGCACGDSTESQTFAEYQSAGPAFNGVPDDVQAELATAIQTLTR